MDLYNTNLAAFQERYADLVKVLKHAGSGNCLVVKAKNGAPTLKIKLQDKEVFIHSAYDPQKEARRWAGEVTVQPGDMLNVFGFGMGYHIIELVKKVPADANIIIIEPNPAHLNLAMAHLPLADLMTRENVHLVLGEDIPALKRAFIRFVDLYRLDRVKTASYLPLTRTCADAFQPFFQTVYDQLLIQYVNISTVLFYSFQWTKNFFANLKDTFINPGVASLFGKLAGKPAILVSAGPSLTKNVHLLEKARDKAFILCVGSALRVLLNRGIQPDLVLSVDGSEANFRHFQNLPEHRLPLVFDPVLHYGIVENYRGPKFIALCSDLVLKTMNFFIREEKGFLKVGPSVANVSLDLLRKMGADPIIFIGQDLAYTGGVSHASGTSHDTKTVADLENSNKLLEVEGFDGGRVLTDRPFYTFIKWFESYMAEHPETTYINATEGGARIPGTVGMTLQEALDKYCRRKKSYAKMLADIHGSYRGPSEADMAGLLEKLRDTRDQVAKIKKTARQGLKKSESLAALYKNGMPDLAEVDKILVSLDKVDREIMKKQQGTLVTSLMFQPCIQALRQMGGQAPDDEDEREKGLRIAAESVLLYYGLKKVTDLTEKLIGSAMDKFEQD